MKKFLIGFLILLVAVLLAGCGDEVETGESTKKEMEQTESNQTKLAATQPPPTLKYSLARAALIRRLKRMDQQNMTSYIYLIDAGKLIYTTPVDGYVQSLNSMLTTPEQVVGTYSRGDYTTCVLPSPDFDGTYGQNPDAIFFFTPDDSYCEWKGKYFWSDKPKNISTPPLLVARMDSRGHILDK